MKIAIIGGGRVGGTLGGGLARVGHTIIYGSRDPSASARAADPDSYVDTIANAVAAADIVILSTPWNAAEDALRSAGDFGGKPLFDATNPIGAGMRLTHGHTDSGAEQVARWARGARVVKVFNTTGFENMAAPQYGEYRAAMFVAGDDPVARAIAKQLATELGFDVVDAGALASARLLEPLALLWIQLARQPENGRNFAFALVRR